MRDQSLQHRVFVTLLGCACAAGLAAVGQQSPGAAPLRDTSSKGLFAELHWRQIGPFRGGRTKSATGVPGQPNVFYIGAVNGGVWRSTDYGTTWQPIFDDAPTGSVGAIAVAPSDPNVIYVGSGEGLQRPDLSTGDGIYKSTDAGKSWTHLGLRDGQQIPQIVVDPRNADRLFVAVLGHPYGPNEERGVFRSMDGGQSFKKVLYKDENTGAVDLAIDPSNANHIYAVLWEARQGPWENGVFTGPNSGLFESNDSGDTWHPLTNGLPTFEQGLGRIGITIAPSDPRRMYAAVEARQNGGLYRSDDAGQSWRKATDNDLVVTRGDDFAEVKVDPKNPDIVYTASIVAWKSVDGGRTFSSLRGAPGGDDYHRIWINPDDTNILIIGSDQGAVVTVNGGNTWSTWYNQPTAQFYHVSADNAFPYRVCGGQQESGSACVASRSDDGRITFRDWHPVGVEEYGYVAPDPLNPDIVYGGKVTRYDRRTGNVIDVSPRPGMGGQSGEYRTVRTQPLVFSPIDPHILYFASNQLWKTTTGGLQGWTVISPDLTRNTWEVPPNVGIFKDSPAARVSQKGVIYTIAPGYTDPNRIWAGTDDGLIQTTADGGKNWTDVTPPQLKAWAKVSMMDASHTNPLGAYAAINTFRLDELHPHIYRTRDGGKTWTEIVTGIADGTVVNSVKEDPKQKGLLFAGTETETYVSLDDGDHWQSLRVNMPATSIRDVMIKDDDLIAGTHGRGFWILDDVTPLRQLAAAGAQPATAHLFKPQTAIRFDWSKYTDTPLPVDEPAGQNPPDGAIINYYLPQPADGVVTLEVLDPAGKTIRRFSSDEKAPEIRDIGNTPRYWIRPTQILAADAGLHRFVWDLHYPMLPGALPSYPISATPHNTPAEPRGPWVVPGTYTVKLTVNGQALAQPLTVKMDPRVKSTAATIAHQFALAKRVYDASADLEHAKGQIAAAEQRARSGGDSQRADQLAALAGSGGEGRGRGRGAARTAQPTLASVSAELQGVYRLTQEGAGPISAQAVKTVEEALARYEALTRQIAALTR
ncbi:MAG TPA: hypothetical protein VL262_06495 [Vicinamibacterales bacterium]|nr:hypothetical protein [Vicinamibacterales bacterium]